MFLNRIQIVQDLNSVLNMILLILLLQNYLLSIQIVI
nr:MAG TPA: hypothetical protein [Caudoviricetes sp.]